MLLLSLQSPCWTFRCKCTLMIIWLQFFRRMPRANQILIVCSFPEWQKIFLWSGPRWSPQSLLQKLQKWLFEILCKSMNCPFSYKSNPWFLLYLPSSNRPYKYQPLKEHEAAGDEKWFEELRHEHVLAARSLLPHASNVGVDGRHLRRYVRVRASKPLQRLLCPHLLVRVE